MRIVSPQRVLYEVQDREELKALVTELKLGWKLGGNLCQLCGWEQVGADRTGRGEADNWQKLCDVTWLKRDGSDVIVPVVGKPTWIMENVPELKDMMQPASLRKLRNGNLKVVNGWRCVAQPPAVAQLSSGTSLVGLPANASSAVPAQEGLLDPEGCSISAAMVCCPIRVPVSVALAHEFSCKHPFSM